MEITIHATPENKKTIIDLAEEQGFSIPCNCHGANACGGRQYPFPCTMVPHRDTVISLPDTDEINVTTLDAKADKTVLPDSLLIDIGTTTVAMVFYHSGAQTVFHSVTFANPQRAYGADVISRIKYDVEFHDDYTLKKLICDEISAQFHTFLRSRRGIRIETCLIGGNTTMIHLLLGFPLDGMAKSPFTPYAQARLHIRSHDTDVYIVPWLSAFIGGDITAGLLSLHFDTRKDTCLLTDLGTNGELALLHSGILFTAGTAAGPAFEGGGLSCGCPAIPGAISDVTWNAVMPVLRTIGNKLPSGICGSGAVSILSELITHGYLLPSGILADKFPKNGVPVGKTISGTDIRFTASDVRQMQLATAAIGAGIDALCRRAGICVSDIRHLYLAGGFGHHIHTGKASVTGLFSNISTDRITPVGNSCLSGLAMVSSSLSSLENRTARLKTICHEHILADDDYFEQQFIRHMTYESISTR